MARPLAAMESSKRPDRWGTLSDEALGAFESSRGDSQRHLSSPYRGGMGLTRWIPMRARGNSGRCCCKRNPTNPRDLWAIGVAPSTQPSVTTARRSGSASWWCGPPSFSVPISWGRVSRCARTTRHSNGCYTRMGPMGVGRGGSWGWRSSTTWCRRDRVHPTTRRTRCRASRHPR